MMFSLNFIKQLCLLSNDYMLVLFDVLFSRLNRQLRVLKISILLVCRPPLPPW